MISEIVVKGYRKFSDFKINNLSRINFFVGNNNAGKTTLLEAIFGWTCGRNLSPFFWTCIQRNGFSQNFTAYHIADNIASAVSNKENIPFSFELSAIDDNNSVSFKHTISLGDIFKEFVLDISMNVNNPTVTITPNSNIMNNMYAMNNTLLAQWDISGSDGITKTHWLSWPNLFIENVAVQKKAGYRDIITHRSLEENRNLYAYLKRQKLLNVFLEEIKSVFPDIEDLDILPYPNNSLAPVCVKTANEDYFPLDSFGDGLRRLFQVIGSIIFNHDSVICIDEIDATLHPKAQENLCECIIKYARKYNTQLFVTTHNLEFIDYFLNVWNNDNNLKNIDDIRIITMKNVDKDVKIRNMCGTEAQSSRENFQLELR